jgi:ABC-type sugar transport system ATPase subunit
LGIRPESIGLVSADEADLVGRVEVVEPLGNATLLHVAIGDGGSLRVLLRDFPRDRAGDEIGLRLDRSGLHYFDSASGSRL